MKMRANNGIKWTALGVRKIIHIPHLSLCDTMYALREGYRVPVSLQLPADPRRVPQAANEFSVW